jgi:hypothetical protein
MTSDENSDLEMTLVGEENLGGESIGGFGCFFFFLVVVAVVVILEKVRKM